MKNILLAFGFVLLVGAGVVQAQSEVIKLYDDVLTLPGCKSGGAGSCAELDNTLKSDVKKLISLKRFVPGSGYVAVYFSNRLPHPNAQGGFSPSQMYFEPISGGRVELGGGMQIFERGYITVEFTQPYTATERLPVEYDFVFYYLPHTEEKRQQFLIMLQDDPGRFVEYKEQNDDDISLLCSALRNMAKIPEVCPESSTVTPDDFQPGSLTTDPDDLPELDFSGRPTRRPVVALENYERLVFVGEPVEIRVDQVSDPDGKCQLFEFRWRKSDDLMVQNASVDPYLGDLFFIPQNAGVFTLAFQAREACKELGTLTSEMTSVRLIVNEKGTIFPDIDSAPGYQNALYQLYHLGVLKGYPDGTIRPNELVNRAEFLKMIFETLLYQIDQEVFSPRYSDVLPSDWFAYYVWQADVLGVIKGYPDGRFRPEQAVNLAEALKMVMHFSTIELLDTQVYSFSDFTSEDWYSRYVQTAFREGILDDIQPGGPVRAWQPISRGKAALIIVRTLLYPVNRINPTNADVLRRPEQFVDFSSFEY